MTHTPPQDAAQERALGAQQMRRGNSRLQSSEQRQAYLLALGDAIRPLADPLDIQATASRVLGEYLSANRVTYFDIRNDHYVVERDYSRDSLSFAGARAPVVAFGATVLESYRTGRNVIHCDIPADSTLSGEERAAYAAAQVGAFISVPLVKNGEFIVGLAVQSREPREWTPDEIELVEETAERTWAVVERARAERELARSEKHFRTLFDSIDQGFCTIELLFDPHGKPYDYRIIEINAAFEQQTGISNGVGRRMREIAPDHEAFWFERYGQIALSGQPMRFEHAAAALGRFYDVQAFRVGEPTERRVAVLFNDITDRKRREANLAFLAEISRDLVPLNSIDESMPALGAKIGSHLGISRCMFGQVVERTDEVRFVYEWHRQDVASIAGVYRAREFLTDAFKPTLLTDSEFVINDVQSDPRVNAVKFAQLGVAAFICMPIIQSARWRFVLVVQNSRPRVWHEDEIALMRELTARIWSRIERADAEKALRASEERHRSLFSQMISGVVETDMDGRFTTVNSRFCEILGYSCTEVVNLRIEDVVHPHDLAASRAKLEHLARTGQPFEIEKRYIRKDGSIVWVHNSVSALTDGDGRRRGVVAVSVDVTDRKRHEEQLQRGAELLDFIIEHSPSGFYIVDADLRISHMNADSQARLFRNVDPAIGRGLDEALRVVWPEPLATTILGIFRQTLETGEPYRSSDFVSPRADVAIVETYEWQLQRITMPDGRYAVVCYYYDTTRLREVEQELRDADRRKDEFLATLAHELRNPLAPIRTSLHILRRPDVDRRAMARVQDMMERQVSHLVRLVDDLLEVSRITRGKFELRKALIDLSDVVRSAIETSTPLIEAGGHYLHISLPDEPLLLEADAVRLAQVLANLLNNAAKYTDSGGHIWISARRDGSTAEVVVRDDGAGIPPQMLSKVFDLFTQADRTFNRAQGGLGIGLTLVRSLVSMHGGTVEARSEGPGHGSEFLVRLPLSAERTKQGKLVGRVGVEPTTY